MFAFAVLSIALLASQASASAILGRSPLASLLSVRQTGGFDPNDIPASCSVQCATTSEVLAGTACQSTSCLCTPQVNLGFQQCLQCLIDLAGGSPSLVSQSQDAIAEYENSCKDAGVPLTSLTITGGASATGGSSISLPSGSASRSGSVFFTSTALGASSTAGGGALTSVGDRSTSSRAVITAVSSSGTSSPTGTTGGEGDNAQGVTGGASATVAGLSSIALTAAAGIVFLMGF